MAAASVAVNGLVNKTKNLDNGFFDGWAGAALGGALSGGVASAMAGAVSSHLPSANLDLGGGFSVGLSPSLAFGTDGIGLGANLMTGFKNDNFNVGLAFGATYYNSAPGTGLSGLETRLGGGGGFTTNGGFGLSYYQTRFKSGETSQKVGNLVASYKEWSFTFENDVKYLGGDNGDRFRTHASVIGYRDYRLGLNMFTGDPGLKNGDRKTNDTNGPKGTYTIGKNGENPNLYRMGALYFGYKNNRIGTNSENIRDFVQNKVIHRYFTKSPYFEKLNSRWSIYGGVYSQNPYTAW